MCAPVNTPLAPPPHSERKTAATTDWDLPGTGCSSPGEQLLCSFVMTLQAVHI